MTTHKINILLKQKFNDPKAKKVLEDFKEYFQNSSKNFSQKNFQENNETKFEENSFAKNLENLKITTAKCYQISGNYNDEQIEKVSQELFSDKIIEQFFINSFPNFDFDYAVEIGFKDGVTDNISTSALEGVKDILGKDFLQETKIKSFHCYFFDFFEQENRKNKKNSLEEIKNFTKEYLYNPLIESSTFISKENWQGNFPFQKKKEILPIKEFYQTIDLNISDDELVNISKKMTLSLNLEEMKAIQNYFLNQKEQRKKK